jgi:hypothetical protein
MAARSGNQGSRLVTETELAAECRVSQSAIRKAVAAGRLSRRPDGTFDLALALQEWTQNRRRVPGPGRPRSTPPSETPQSRARSGGRSRDDGPPEKTLMDLAIEHERVKIAQRRLDVRRKRGELVSWRPFRQQVFEFVRRERDHWQTWPARVAKGLADEFSVEAGPLQIALEGRVREALRELAQKLPLETGLVPLEARQAAARLGRTVRDEDDAGARQAE